MPRALPRQLPWNVGNSLGGITAATSSAAQPWLRHPAARRLPGGSIAAATSSAAAPWLRHPAAPWLRHPASHAKQGWLHLIRFGPHGGRAEVAQPCARRSPWRIFVRSELGSGWHSDLEVASSSRGLPFPRGRPPSRARFALPGRCSSGQLAYVVVLGVVRRVVRTRGRTRSRTRSRTRRRTDRRSRVFWTARVAVAHRAQLRRCQGGAAWTILFGIQSAR